TDRGWVIEFQHSYIKPEERRFRDAFYKKLIWVVDGTGKRDRAGFLNALRAGRSVGASIRMDFPDECALLRKWAGSDAPIFFDFGEEGPLWWLFAKSPGGPAYVAPFSRTNFIEIHRGG